MKISYLKAIHQIIHYGHFITHRVSQELKEFDISEPQFNVLRILKGSRGKALNLQDISAKMVQKNSNVTRIVNKLVDRNLVIQQQCPTNRRKVEITITPEGKTFLKKLEVKVENIHHPFNKNLNTNELENLNVLLHKLFKQYETKH